MVSYGRVVKHKFGAVKCERNGIKFPSKLERACYDRLMILEMAGEFKFFLRQIPFDLPGQSIHKIDYCVFYEDYVCFIEAKGRDLPLGKLKRKQVEDIYGITVNVVKSANEIDGALRIEREKARSPLT